MTAQGTGLGPVRAGLTVMAALLIFQFALGMWVNLYVSIPQLAPGYGMMGVMLAVMYSVGTPVLMLHMMLGWLMAAGALMVFVLSLIEGRTAVIGLAVVGLASVLLAGLGGLFFLFSGGDNAYSYLMALAFVFAFSAYFSALVIARQEEAEEAFPFRWGESELANESAEQDDAPGAGGREDVLTLAE